MQQGPRIAIAIVAATFALFSLSIAVLMPAWEPADEADHVLNVETLVRGDWYRIEGNSGYEPHQPPLYYLALAGWQKALLTSPRDPRPTRLPASKIFSKDLSCSYGVCAVYRHNNPREARDKRMVLLLRIPSILCGVGVLLFTSATGRRLSRDPWTPVVAAALVAGVPQFVFLSGFVNNDNLTNLLAAALLLASVVFVNRGPHTGREGWGFAVLLGGLSGLLLLTKLSSLALLLAVVVAIVLATNHARPRLVHLAITGASALLVAGFWLLQNQRWYGDPLAVRRSKEYLSGAWGGIRFGLGFPRNYGVARILFVDIPSLLYRTFWYDSALGHLPLWIAIAVAIGGLAIRSAHATPRNPRQLILLFVFVAAALVAFGAVIMQTATARASVAYIGLPALVCLAALGLERLPIPVVARFVGPLVGAVTTALGIRGIIEVFHT